MASLSLVSQNSEGQGKTAISISSMPTGPECLLG